MAAGDALLAIEEYVPRRRISELRAIRRQNPALARSADEKRLIREYREAVKDASELKTAQSFDRLDAMGWVRELPDEPRRAAIAGEYLLALQRGEKPLVVSQTWNEVHAANEAVRSALQSAGKLARGEILTAFQPVDRTEAQKRDRRFYQAGQAAFFLRRYGRHMKGEVCEIAGASENGVVIVSDGRRSRISYRYVDRFAVVQRRQIEVSPGDKLLLKANRRSVEGVRLHNGELVTVSRLDRTGAVVVTDERGTTKTLSHSQRLFVHGYAVTSYASQGKTVDTVIVADVGGSTANARHWYVGISRGRKRVVVLTPDKTELRDNVRRSGEFERAMSEQRQEIVERQAMVQRERLWHRIRNAQEYHERLWQKEAQNMRQDS